MAYERLNLVDGDTLTAEAVSHIESGLGSSYQRLNLVDGDVLTAEHIAHIEDGILSAQSGGSGSVEEKDVIFIDYDGTILYSYTVEEAQALTELPALPSHDGLICQGWNFDLETIKEYNREVVVGAMYITDDGTTRIYIELQEGTTSPMVGLAVKGTVTVDWGDGSTPDTLTGTNTGTVVYTESHEYGAAGEYVIRLTVDGEAAIVGEYKGICLLPYVYYRETITRVEIGDNIWIRGYAFVRCLSLVCITLPKTLPAIYSYAFSGCTNLSSITVPLYAQSSCFEGCNMLKRVSIPATTETASNICSTCYSLERATIYDTNGISLDVGSSSFYQCYSLSRLSIVTSGIGEDYEYGAVIIGYRAFYQCSSLRNVTIINPGGLSIGLLAFYKCCSLESINLTSFGGDTNIASIGESAFSNCYFLKNVTGNINYIDEYAFSNCRSLRCVDFSSCVSVPALESANAFKNCPSDMEILVPAALYDEWIAATNWSTYASQIVAV